LDDESYRIVASAKVERYLSKDRPEYASGDEVNMIHPCHFQTGKLPYLHQRSQRSGNQSLIHIQIKNCRYKVNTLST